MICLDKLPNSQPQETVKLSLRRHWIDILRIVLFTSFMLLVPVVIFVLLRLGDIHIGNNPFWGPFSMLLLLAYLFVVFVTTITDFTDYWLDVWIVTTERILNAEQHGLFNRTVSEVHLEQIQDITSETKGLLATFLTYGDVFVQTAAEKERFRFKDVDNPDDVKITISELVSTCQNSHHHEASAITPSIGAPNNSQHNPDNIKM